MKCKIFIILMFTVGLQHPLLWTW